MFRPWADHHAKKLQDRAQRLRRESRWRPNSSQPDPGHWHQSRADALNRELAEVAGKCGSATAVVACSCEARFVPANCGRYKYCESCLADRRRELHARITRSLLHVLELPESRGAEVYLCTLTTPHSGFIEEDLRFLKRAVPDFLEVARTFGALPAYVYVYELTNGNDNQGHVHAHVAMLAGYDAARGHAWLDYNGASDQWERISSKHGRPSVEGRKLQRPDFRRDDKSTRAWRDPSGVSSYLASHALPSYLTKAEESEGLTDDKLGTWIGATYGKRLVITSKRFWYDPKGSACKCCGSSFVFVAIAKTPERLRWLEHCAMMEGRAVRVVLPHSIGDRPPDDS